MKWLAWTKKSPLDHHVMIIDNDLVLLWQNVASESAKIRILEPEFRVVTVGKGSFTTKMLFWRKLRRQEATATSSSGVWCNVIRSRRFLGADREKWGGKAQTSSNVMMMMMMLCGVGVMQQIVVRMEPANKRKLCWTESSSLMAAEPSTSCVRTARFQLLSTVWPFTSDIHTLKAVFLSCCYRKIRCDSEYPKY